VNTRVRSILAVSTVVACASLVWALAAGAGTAQKTLAPYCKSGQKTTPAHPCRKPPVCKTGQKSTAAHPCTKPVAATTSGSSGGGATTTTTTTTPKTSSGGSSGSSSNSCGPGQAIPQGIGAGDEDDDNNGGPDDGDGCV
jgi:hypothetical protein